MTKTNIEQLIKLLAAAIETNKEKVSVLRNEMRGQLEELESVIESLNEADLNFESGLRDLNAGVDALSQYV